MNKKALAIVIAVAAILVLYPWTTYNRFVTLNENIDGQWAQVESQYQRRFDLIPNLVNSVKGAMAQEQEVFTALADARTRYAGAATVNEKVAAANAVETAFGRLLAIMENYPQLQSIAAVRDLMTQLEGTENRISVERMRFNDATRTYNTMAKRFPARLIAGMFGFDERAYFEAAEGSETAPVVELE